jgi:hypothetical protein
VRITRENSIEQKQLDRRQYNARGVELLVLVRFVLIVCHWALFVYCFLNYSNMHVLVCSVGDVDKAMWSASKTHACRYPHNTILTHMF